MVGPVRPLAVLTTVLRELAAGTGSQSYVRHEAIRVAWILTLRRTRVVHFEAPRAVLVYSELVSHCHNWVTFEDWLAYFSTLNRPRRNKLPLASPWLTRVCLRATIIKIGSGKLLRCISN